MFRFAEAIEVNLNVIDKMTWITEDSMAFGKLTINAKQAKSVNMNFSDFFLPEKSELYFYDKTRKNIIGAITSKENNKTNSWGSPIIIGDEVIIEIKVPISLKAQARLFLKEFSYGYIDIYGFGQAAPCHINANCPSGNSWNVEKNSVALILDGNGEKLATGALVANTCNLNIPYFLTGDHVVDKKDVSQFRFVFQYLSPTCTPSQDDVTNVILYGAVERARYAPAEAALLELFQVPSFSLGLAYSGWSRAGVMNTTVLHHPKGDVMKISRDFSQPVGQVVNNVSCYRLALDEGIVEDGSSGAPYYDQNHRIIGTHFGRFPTSNNNCEITNAIGGRFDVAWTGGGTNSSRLSNWLDPLNSGTFFTNSVYVSSTISPNEVVISGASGFCSGPEIYSLVNLPAGCSVSWSSWPSSIASISPSGYTATLTKIVDGVTTLTANVTTPCGTSFSIHKEISVGTPPPLNFSICGYDPSQNCRYGRIVFSVYTEYTYPTTYSWYVDGVLMATTSDPVWSFVPQVPCDSYIELRVVVTTACGTSSGAGEVIYYACQGGFFSYYSLSPNPAKGKVIVKTKSSDKTKELPQNKKYIKEVRILNKNYIEIKRMQFANLTELAEVDLPNVPADTYFISVFDGKKWYTEKLLISN